MENKKIHSIELGRVIAIFAILAMHCQMFLSYWLVDDTPWFGYLFNQATRFAVPLFFLISGYLIQPKLETAALSTVKNYIAPLIRIFVVWSIICLLMPFNLGTVMEHGYLTERQGYWGYLAQTPVNSLLEGGLVHLWFIPALIIAAIIAGGLYQFKAKQLLLPIGVVLYVYGVLAGSYSSLTELNAPIFTRNGPFFSTLLFAIGIAIREKSWAINSTQALFIAAIGMLVHFSEAYLLHSEAQVFNANDFLFGTALWGVGCFMWLLTKPNLGEGFALTKLAKYVLPIYVSHLPMIIVMMNVTGILGLTGFSKDMTTLLGTIILTLLLVIGVARTPLNRWLFR